jgi:hypothetical protein
VLIEAPRIADNFVRVFEKSAHRLIQLDRHIQKIEDTNKPAEARRPRLRHESGQGLPARLASSVRTQLLGGIPGKKRARTGLCRAAY